MDEYYANISAFFRCFNDSCSFSGRLAQVPVTETPSGKSYPGKFIWHDLLTPDPRSAGKFYEELFGWQIDYQGHYAVVRHDGKRIAGILQVEPADGRIRDGVWLPSVSVADVDAAASLVEANGGKILKGPIDMDQKGGDPADDETAIGDWLWDEIWTIDPDSTREFYQSVLGYDEMALGEYRLSGLLILWRLRSA